MMEVKWKISVENEQEVRFKYRDLPDLARKIREYFGPAASMLEGGRAHTTMEMGWTVQEVQDVISDNIAKNFFRYVVGKGGKAAVPDVKQELHLERQQLGGPLSSLTKRYHALGKEPLHYVDWNDEVYMVNSKYLDTVREAIGA